MSRRNYGWKKDVSDTRDLRYHMTRDINPANPLPASVDLRAGCPPVYDQGQLGSCTSQAVSAAYEFDEIKQGNKDRFPPSRLFTYYNERLVDGNVNEDAGSSLRTGMQVINKYGVCHETIWPYLIEKFTVKPVRAAYTDAKHHKSISYERLNQNEYELKHCLASGYPFVFGFMVYPSFETEEVAKTGLMPMPGADEKPLGGHAVICVGYREDGRFIIRNSWGPSFADAGYFYMPKEFLLDPNQSDDFWTLRQVSPK